MSALNTLAFIANAAIAAGPGGVEDTSLLATVDECSQNPRPEGKTCIDDLSAMIRSYDGLSFVTNNVPAGSGLRFHRNGGVDRVDGPEDHDGRISPDEYVIPALYVNAPWQTPMCEPSDLAAVDAAVARGEVPQDWGDEMKASYAEIIEGQQDFLYCMSEAVSDIATRRIMETVFRPMDIDGDGYLSKKDDKNGDNRITKEDQDLQRAQQSSP